MVKGELVHLKDGKTFPVEECGAVFCVSFKVAERTDKRVASIAQAILITDNLAYARIFRRLGCCNSERVNQDGKRKSRTGIRHGR